MPATAARLPLPDLPPGFELTVLREREDAFRHACNVAAQAGAGTLIWVRRFDLLEFAVVLEPEEPLASARRAFFPAMSALGDAVGAACPPDKPVEFDWPGTLLFDGARLGGGRLGWPETCGEEEVPDWLVFGAMLIASKHGAADPGLTPDSTSLEYESSELTHEELIETFARNLMRAFHVWKEQGFAPLAADYLSRLAAHDREGAELSDNGDLIVNRTTRRAFVPELEKAAWLDKRTGRPRL
jgi:biotin-(acetyl-CoA carboxylase) ligase